MTTSYPSDFNKPDKVYWTGQPGKGNDWGIPLTQDQAMMYAPFAPFMWWSRLWMGMIEHASRLGPKLGG